MKPYTLCKKSTEFSQACFFFKDTKTLLRSVARIIPATPTYMGTKQGHEKWMVWDENKENHNHKLTKSDRVEGKTLKLCFP